MIKIGVVGVPGSWSSENLAKTVEEKTDFKCLIDMSKIFFNLENGQVSYGNINLASLDALIIKKIGAPYSPHLLDRLEILNTLSETGLKIFSKPKNIMSLLNRLSCTVRLRQGNIPMPPTVITEDVDQAMETVKTFGKAILKPLYTSKARGMIVLEYDRGARFDIERYMDAGNRVIYIQKFLPINGRDFGIAFLGGKYLATYARVANKNSWNSTIISGGRYEPYNPSDEIISLANKAQTLFNLDFTCVDLAETPDGPKVFEVSAFGGFRGLLDANGIDSAALYTDYVIEKIKNG